MKNYFCLYLLIKVVQSFGDANGEDAKSFVINYEGDQFMKDGKPYRYISGTMHYFRVPHQYWDDRLKKLKYLGLNTIQTYIAWNFHETYQGVYNFTEDHDIFRFLQLAQENDLNVILRPGPYIDAEWDLGGLPYWILKNETLVSQNTLRTSDDGYMQHVTNWFDEILPKIKPFLYHNGGPIVMVQVENEYGSYFAHDTNYLITLRDQIRSHLGPEIVLFTTDGNGEAYLRYGKIPEVYATIDFGSNSDVGQSFGAQRKAEPRGPLINSEYYTGWIDHWGAAHSHVDAQAVAKTLAKILDTANGTCVNLYVVEGGTSFAFMNGANYDSSSSAYLPNPTSYDFDAPLNEGGDPTPKYFVLRDVIGKYQDLPEGSIPVHPRQGKIAYGSLTMTTVSFITDMVDNPKYFPSGGKYSVDVPSFEQLDNPYGFVLYRHHLSGPTPDINGIDPLYERNITVRLPDLRDRAHLFFDGDTVGILSRMGKVLEVTFFAIISPKSVLDIMVENQGRICYGSSMNDTKGPGTIYLDDVDTKDWVAYPVDLERLAAILEKPAPPPPPAFVPSSAKVGTGQHISAVSKRPKRSFRSLNCPSAFFVGHFKLGKKYGDSPNDTYLNMAHWTKGQVILNGKNLGRYWPTRGPLQTMYVPGIYLKPYPQENAVVIFDLEPQSPCDETDQSINFVKEPIYQSFPEMNLASHKDHDRSFGKSWLSLIKIFLEYVAFYVYPVLANFH